MAWMTCFISPYCILNVSIAHCGFSISFVFKWECYIFFDISYFVCTAWAWCCSKFSNTLFEILFAVLWSYQIFWYLWLLHYHPIQWCRKGMCFLQLIYKTMTQVLGQHESFSIFVENVIFVVVCCERKNNVQSNLTVCLL